MSAHVEMREVGFPKQAPHLQWGQRILRRRATELRPVVVLRAGITPGHVPIALVDHLIVLPVGLNFNVDRVLAVQNQSFDALERVVGLHFLGRRN